jgi:hypothetical protein
MLRHELHEFSRTELKERGSKGLLLLLCLSVALLAGCGTTPGNVAYRSEGTTILTVDAGMRAWADYVAQEKASPGELDAVRNAYERYYAAQMTVKAALELYLATANPDNADALSKLTAAAAEQSTALINLIRQFTKP